MPVLPLEAEPSGTAATRLFPTERYPGEWRRHTISLSATELASGGRCVRVAA